MAQTVPYHQLLQIVQEANLPPHLLGAMLSAAFAVTANLAGLRVMLFRR